jgi:hypothetical protein
VQVGPAGPAAQVETEGSASVPEVTAEQVEPAEPVVPEPAGQAPVVLQRRVTVAQAEQALRARTQ